MIRIKLVLAVVGAIVGMLMARDVSLRSAREMETYESWQGPYEDE